MLSWNLDWPIWIIQFLGIILGLIYGLNYLGCGLARSSQLHLIHRSWHLHLEQPIDSSLHWGIGDSAWLALGLGAAKGFITAITQYRLLHLIRPGWHLDLVQPKDSSLHLTRLAFALGLAQQTTSSIQLIGLALWLGTTDILQFLAELFDWPIDWRHRKHSLDWFDCDGLSWGPYFIFRDLIPGGLWLYWSAWLTWADTFSKFNGLGQASFYWSDWKLQLFQETAQSAIRGCMKDISTQFKGIRLICTGWQSDFGEELNWGFDGRLTKFFEHLMGRHISQGVDGEC